MHGSIAVSAPGAASRGALVLAGGRSTRMGRDKASLPFGDGTLLSRVVGVLARAVPEIVVVARRGQRLPALTGLPAGVVVRVAHDEVEGQGPLGGLVPGLGVLEAETAYVSSCDAPLLQEAFVRRMFDLLGAHDIAMPEADGHLQPLASVVRRDAVRGPAAALLAEGRLRPVYLLERVAHVVVPADALRAVDPELLSLANLNTPEAYEAARARLAGRGGA